MTKKQQIIRLYKKPVITHISYSEIARKAKCAKSYVYDVLKEAKEKGEL